jgi:hypothetical protein
MSKHPRLSGQLRLILAITIVHVVAWFGYYSQIPAGQYAGEEARATLDAAHALAEGIPFSQDNGYSLYTYTLSLLDRSLGEMINLTTTARALNGLAFVLAVGCCASAASHYWRLNRAIWISGLLVGLNPVLVFWAGEITPALLATACFSIALWQLQTWLRHPKFTSSGRIGLCLVLAALFETTLIPFALLWPIIACIHPRKERSLNLLLALIPIVIAAALVWVSHLQLQTPWQWHINEIGSNLYRALSNSESSDQKSFELYRQLHFLLFLNPIHWGILLILACAGFYTRLKDGHRRHSILIAITMLALFAISFALNQSGSQARACLIPLLAFFAAGIAILPKIWHHGSPRTHKRIIIGSCVLVCFAYGSHLLPVSSKEWERDYIHLAKANIAMGNNDRASTWAAKALETGPDLNEMQEILVLTQFNKWAIGKLTHTLPIEEAKSYLDEAQKIEATADTRSIEAIYLYKLREVEAAQAIWREQSPHSALALICLYWTGEQAELNPNEISAYEGRPYYPLLKAAKEVDRSALEYSITEKQIDNILAFAY